MSGRFESSVGNSEYSADSNTNVVGSLESGAEAVAGSCEIKRERIGRILNTLNIYVCMYVCMFVCMYV